MCREVPPPSCPNGAVRLRDNSDVAGRGPWGGGKWGGRRDRRRRCSCSSTGDQLLGLGSHLLVVSSIVVVLVELRHRSLREIAALGDLPLVVDLDEHRAGEAQRA